MRINSKRIFKLFTIILITPIILGCGGKDNKTNSGKIRTVSSITIINDVVKNIGGDKIEAVSICGVGLDPHTYKPKPNDPRLISESDIVFINGFALEHWIEEMVRNAGGNKKVVTVTEGLTPMTDEKGYGDPDPHAWFNVQNVKTYATNIEKALSEYDKPNATYYKQNLDTYLKKLDSLDAWIKTEIAMIPPEKRVLITSHDAFRYFGKAYGLEVRGLQGISTEAKAQTEDVKKLIDLIKERKLSSVFIETSVNPKLLEEISKETGATVGGTLFSDSVGNEGTPEGTYTGAVTFNVNTIVKALK
ncbi:MAG: zinc ABC transporter substrate-binding protein [Ignavibacteria bacterium]|nr:zinc ABC transporter substrate-binding protein [Ignavibacteria bacterium]